MFFSAVFREAVKRQYVERNPVRGIKQLPEDNMIVRWLTDQEETRLFSFAPSHLKPILLVALHSGMRQGEILGLRWSEVDFDREVIRVVGTKSHKNRFVPMNPVLLSTLKGIAPFVGSQGPCPYVFLNPETETRYETLKTCWQSTIRKSGIQNFRFHDLRHTFASRLIQRGASLKAVQELLGHADLKMTLRYAHLSPSNLRDAVFALVKKAPSPAAARGGKRGARRA
jgi:integrase